MKRRRKKPHRVHLDDRGIYIFESRHSPDFEMEIVERDFHHLYVVREGQGFVETESERVPIREHQLCFAPANSPHRLADDPSDPLTIIVLCFYESIFGDCTTAVESLSLFRQNFPAFTPFKVADNYTRLQIRNRLKGLFPAMLRPGRRRSTSRTRS